MKVAKQDLDQIIQEEINEIFGFGKKKAAKEYPATELTTLLAMIQKASRMSGVKLKGSRGVLVDEFEKILASDGFKLKEANERLFIGKDGNIKINSKIAPVLTNFLTTLKSESPDVFSTLTKQMKNYRFDIPTELAAAEAAASEEDESAPEAEAAPQTPPYVLLSMSDRGPKAPSSSIESIALALLKLKKAPNPNGTPEEYEASRKLSQLMNKLTKGFYNVIKQIAPDAKVQSVNEGSRVRKKKN